jgi:hypothetical protein
MTLLRFVPHFLMLFGVLADAFTYEGVYWTGTAVGLASTFAAPIMSQAVSGLMASIGMQPAAPAAAVAVRSSAEYAGIRMLAMDADESAAPETLIVSASILSYYIFDLITNLSLLDAAGAIVASALLFGGQAFAIPNGASKAAYSGALGVVFGGLCFGFITAGAPQFLPSSAIPGAATNTPSGPAGPGRKGVGMSAPSNGDPKASPARCPLA